VVEGEIVRVTAELEGPTASESVLSPVLPSGSVTDTVNEYLLGLIGIPEIVPVFSFKARPGGRAPSLIEN
jgi:hypothetical protein